MEAYCRYNPSGNPFWCNIIQGYCQFQTEETINEHCPIFQGCQKPEIHIDDDVDDEFLQKHSFATVYDGNNNLVSLGDTAMQFDGDEIELQVPNVRYIGKYAFQNCTNLKLLDFSGKKDDFIPILASPTAFMMSDQKTFVNDSFYIKVPKRLLNEWRNAPNWSALTNHIGA
jgi:hypothetical protein